MVTWIQSSFYALGLNQTAAGDDKTGVLYHLQDSRTSQWISAPLQAHVEQGGLHHLLQLHSLSHSSDSAHLDSALTFWDGDQEGKYLVNTQQPLNMQSF